MSWTVSLAAVAFTVFGAFCVLSIIPGLPGTWIMLGAALIIELADTAYLPPPRTETFGWPVLAGGALLAAFGEVLEFLAAAAGVKSGGGSRRGMVGALIGGIAGALLLTGLIPVPLLGTLLGAIAGTFAGALIGETSGAQAKSIGRAFKPALGATLGRLGGTAGKLAVAVVVWLLLSVVAFTA